MFESILTSKTINTELNCVIIMLFGIVIYFLVDKMRLDAFNLFQ